MSKLVWGTAGERFYETGADRGVLYVGDAAGVAWNGLTQVSEKANGGDAQPYYYEGFKYLNLAAAEEFEATLEAFSSPSEFGPCDGTSQIANGLFITQQPRKPFGLCYRTLVGNDVDSNDHGYKIHMVYNALASPSDRANATVSDSPDPSKLSWGITAKPPALTGYRPSAHMVVDTRHAAPDLVQDLEDILYGVEFVNPRLPTQQELVTMFVG